MLVQFPIYVCLSRKYESFQKKRASLSNYLFIDGSLRMFMEAYLTLCLFSLLNVKEIDWPGFAVTEFSNTFSFIVLPILLIVPIILFVYYFRKRENWSEDEFKAKAGGFIEGIRHDSQTYRGKYTFRETEYDFDDFYVTPKRTQVNLMIWQALFFVRRLLLCWSLVYLDKNFWGQTAIQYFTSVGFIIFI